MERDLTTLGLKKTGTARKLTIGGETKSYEVFSIPLDQVYYNDRNDRIATWMNQYQEEHPMEKLSPELERYNDIIGGFITKSNPDALTKTQNNIALFGQREAGVVLSDGRIIDGNRRYTCLRNLSKKDPKFQYFEAVILQQDLDKSEKQIKMLELTIQHGEESKVGYDPIDKLVGLYRDVEETKLLTVHEYCESTNEKETEVKKQLETATLLVEFLEFINAPGQYYIARELNLNGPLVELQSILKKTKDETQRQSLKKSAFTNFVVGPYGDMTRFVRKFKKISTSTDLDDFLAKQERFSQKVIDELSKTEKVSLPFINSSIRNDQLLKRDILYSVENAFDKAGIEEAKGSPSMFVEKAINDLSQIDIDIIYKLTDEQREELIRKLSSLRSAAKDIIDRTMDM